MSCLYEWSIHKMSRNELFLYVSVCRPATWARMQFWHKNMKNIEEKALHNSRCSIFFSVYVYVLKSTLLSPSLSLFLSLFILCMIKHILMKYICWWECNFSFCISNRILLVFVFAHFGYCYTLVIAMNICWFFFQLYSASFTFRPDLFFIITGRDCKFVLLFCVCVCVYQ